jgi:peptide-methionine (S)-S-oxide reductase
MLFMRKTTALPSAAEALPGRAAPIPTATTHYVNGERLRPPYPDGLAQAVFGLGCFWGAERKFWELGDGVHVTAVGYAGGFTPNPTYEEVCSGRTGHAEVVLVVFDPKKLSYEKLLKTFWENHNPTQGMRQGNDVGTQYRSAIYTFDEAQRKAADGEGLGGHHHRDRARRRVLFRRGLSSAISGQESGRLLRARRHRRVLPDRRRRQRLTRTP